MHRTLAPVLAAVAGILYAGAAWPGLCEHTEPFITVKASIRLEVPNWRGSGRPLVFLAGHLTAHTDDDIGPKLTFLSNDAEVISIRELRAFLATLK